MNSDGTALMVTPPGWASELAASPVRTTRAHRRPAVGVIDRVAAIFTVMRNVPIAPFDVLAAGSS